MPYFLFFTALTLTVISFIKDKAKTKKAFYFAYRYFIDIVFMYLIIIIFISSFLFFISDAAIARYLGAENKLFAFVLAALAGSVSLMPGIIAFPLCGLLLKKGVPYAVLSVFTTSLMMVGILTFPLEKKYFGARMAVLRNIIGFFTAVIVGAATGIFFGEIF